MGAWSLRCSVLFLVLAPFLVGAGPCPVQVYTNPSQEPRYDCPGPGEAGLVPDLQLRPSVALEAGKRAPHAGILMDKERVIQLGLRVKALRRLRWMDVTLAAERLQVERKYLKANNAADLKLRTSQRDSYKEQLGEAQKELQEAKKWYRSWSFGLIVGVLTTSISAVAVALAAR